MVPVEDERDLSQSKDVFVCGLRFQEARERERSERSTQDTELLQLMGKL